jgi:biopolymer transport protein ExbD
MRRRRRSQRVTLSTLSEINVTPLLDLAFVLLIIFMITTPLLENSVSLSIPTSATAEAAIDPAQVQTVSIDREAVARFNNEPIDAATLTARLEQLRQANPEVAVLIRPDRTLPVQTLVTWMEAVQRAGVTKVGVATQPETR